MQENRGIQLEKIKGSFVHYTRFDSTNNISECIEYINRHCNNKIDLDLIENIIRLYTKNEYSQINSKSKIFTFDNVRELVMFYTGRVYLPLLRTNHIKTHLVSSRLNSTLKKVFPYVFYTEKIVLKDCNKTHVIDENLEILYQNFLYLSPFNKDNEIIGLLIIAILSHINYGVYYYPTKKK